MEHAHRAVENLAGSRIADVRALRVFHRRREPADHCVSHVLGRPVRIVRRRIHRNYRILESRGLEGRLPVENCLSHPRLPLLWRRRIYIVDDRFHRLRERRVRIFLLQSVARDVRPICGALLERSKIDLRDGEETDAFVPATRHHRPLGQPDQTPMREYALCLLLAGGSLTAAASTTRTRSWGRRAGLCSFDLYAVGKSERVLDEAAAFIERSSYRRELLHIRRVKSCHINDGGAGRTVGLDVEHRYYGRTARCLLRTINRRAGVGDDGK